MIATEETTNSAPVLGGSSVHHCPHCGAAAIAAPCLENVESGETCALCCFVRRSYGLHGGYVAECLDLDISASAPTVDQAIAGLQDAMVGYLDIAFEGQPTSIKAVLRPAPASHWLRYFLEQSKYRLAASVSESFQTRKNKLFYKVSPFTHCQV